ncbi:SDR family oxidoreductase [Thiohalobacter sp. IOR34]|uniref:SDR family oxidoreductase n=1 Tax=Thiohalobacter sp. IOR34 TaxID=3057176 RepID=UPI0025B2332B|nr:SDR family oxidoreductase [Thiohalobacter sp. IOR34]WJW76707.1 SDR family oxidoreductase [Thiohalobacter sp. IOR34]
MEDPITKLFVGYEDSVRKTITREDVDAFARLSGDYNELHMDDEFAAKTQFEQRVVHGFLHASLLSTLVGMKIPGHGALYLSQEIDFTGPVFIGDTVVATGTITAIDKVTRVIEMDTLIRNQHGDVVLRGKARSKVLRLSEWRGKDEEKRELEMSNLLEGKIALVTGSSRGIGSEIAKTLAANGAMVWINYARSKGAANDTVACIQEMGGKAEIVKADVCSEEEVVSMMETIQAAGGMDILVNNAGPKIASGTFAQWSWEDMASSFESIVGSAFRVTQLALPLLKERQGKIINMISSAALGRTAYNWLPYVTAKSALIGMSKNLAQELGPSGINVNMVSPSMVDTDLVADVPERFRKMMVSQTPLRRMATTNDVAGAVLYLSSPLSDFVTGENILVAGGQVMV